MDPSELDDWAAEASAVVGVALQPGDVAAVLDLARDAAHGIARPAAPLTAFIAGMAVGRGQPTAEAVAALTDAIARRAAPADAGASSSADGPPSGDQPRSGAAAATDHPRSAAAPATEHLRSAAASAADQPHPAAAPAGHHLRSDAAPPGDHPRSDGVPATDHPRSGAAERPAP